MTFMQIPTCWQHCLVTAIQRLNINYLSHLQCHFTAHHYGITPPGLWINSVWPGGVKCARKLFRIPHRTWSIHVHLVCDDKDPETQIMSRFIQFMESALRSQNEIVGICARLALNGSRSIIANNITRIWCKKSKSNTCEDSWTSIVNECLRDQSRVANELIWPRDMTLPFSTKML
jgi:hypothetical protein